MTRRATIRVRVEGCLDAVIARSLVEHQLDALGYRDVGVELPMPKGGKQGVLRDVIRYAINGIRSVAFVDADNDAREALEAIAEKARELRDVSVETGTTPVPHALLKRKGFPVALLAVWGSPPRYTKGTIEDLVCSMLGDACNKAFSCLYGSTTGLCDQDTRHVYKVAVAALLAACSRGTLVYNSELERCGFDIRYAVEALGIPDKVELKPYRELLRQSLQQLLSHPQSPRNKP